MSNHSGSFMLNNVLRLLDDHYNFFATLNKEETLKFVKKIIQIGISEDCNDSEILDEIGKKLGICYMCMEVAADINEDGICAKCY